MTFDDIYKGAFIGVAIFIISLILRKENKIVSIKIRDDQVKTEKIIQVIDHNGYGFYVDLETGRHL